ncbi:DUF5709 domain-containing protein [Pseudonocardia nigra]|uniref:DUF5709 domain-containing protein n=1 Tax=Pseudonocardia nigra TaxID=1921578 RepID=UPI001C5D680C|nr:DUF5709 domain-containing protein [Pseudonocardia nigra]
MAQRDYEEQPEAPDLGASVQLDSEETLTGPSGTDPLDAGYVPPDRPYVLDDDQVTSRGLQEGDTLDERLQREQGEVTADPDRAGRIAIDGEGAALETSDAMDGVDVGVDGGSASAEEAAVHEIDDPGSPAETEPSVANSPALDDPELDNAVGDDPLADRAREEAADDVRADGEVFAPGGAEGSETPLEGGRGGGTPGGGDRSGQGPDPALPHDPADLDPAARIDADSGSGGAASSASGRDDVGPGSGL